MIETTSKFLGIVIILMVISAWENRHVERQFIEPLEQVAVPFTPQGPQSVPTGATRAVISGNTYRGVELQIDLPVYLHVRNTNNRGLGCCTWAAIENAARWQNVRSLYGITARVSQGGGWPDKVDDVMKIVAPQVHYVQYEGPDLDVLDQALAQGRMPSITYGYGERYRDPYTNQMVTVYHMVNLVHLDNQWAAVLDNNYPGNYEWMTRQELKRRFTHPDGHGWACVLLEPPPPPIPHH